MFDAMKGKEPSLGDKKEEYKEKRIMERGIWNCCVVSSCFPAFVLNSVSDYLILSQFAVLYKTAKLIRFNI